MHYYRRNIGDYAKKAARLSILQHGVYNLLIDACYDRECFPTTEEAIDWVWASTSEEIEAVEFVLRKFFNRGDDGKWVQNRIAEELAEYREFSKKQKEKGKKGGRPPKPAGIEKKPSGLSEKPGGNPAVTQRGPEKSLTTNHQPLTTNQEDQNITSSGKTPPTPYEEILREYHDNLPQLPEVRLLTDKRKTRMRVLHSDMMERDIQSWRSYFRRVSESDFLMGRVKEWRADFDFLLTNKSVVGVLEGKYFNA